MARGGTLALFPVFRGNVQSLITKYDVNCRPFVHVFMRLKNFPSVLGLLRVCIMNVKDIFSVYRDDQVVSLVDYVVHFQVNLFFPNF